MIELTTAMLHELFEYVDGGLYWKVNRGKHKTKGKRAGCQRPDGYRIVSINDVKIIEHRLVFLMHHGYLPNYIDHIDGDKSNNRVENLREATPSQNQFNKGPTALNTSGFKGVSFYKGRKKWWARINIQGKKKHLGYFNTPEEAFAAYCAAAGEVHGEFVNVGYEQRVVEELSK